MPREININDDMRSVLRHLAHHFRSGPQRLDTPFDVPELAFENQVAPVLRRLAGAEPPFITGSDLAEATYPMVVTGLTERGWEAVESADESLEPGDEGERALNERRQAETPAVRRQSKAPPSPHDLSSVELDHPLAQAVFIVHGHDSKRKTEVARIVHLLTNSNPIVLHERPNRGRTLIEKFEGHAAEAGFVVVLVTADDHGRARSAGEDRPRARQNVIFEWGFFVGALGRDKVAVLYEEAVELPSDILGVTYISLAAGNEWKQELAREMRSAGVDADLNRL